MNRLRLEARVQREPYWPDSVWVALYVDGREITSREWPSLVDLEQLRESAGTDGAFFIFTCECGDPGCAGIEEPVTVRRDGEGVHWRLGDAWRFVGLAPREGHDWEDEARSADGGAEAGILEEFVFAEEQYAAAIEQDIDSLRAFVGRLEEPVTLTPDTNLPLLKAPGLSLEDARRQNARQLEAWREQHPLPPGPPRWGRLRQN